MPGGRKVLLAGLGIAALTAVATATVQAATNGTISWAQGRVTPKAELVVSKAEWPLNPDCDGATAVAMRRGGPGFQSVPTDPTKDPRTWVMAHGGDPWGQGILTLIFSVTRGATAHVVSIEPVLYERKTAPPQWIYEPAGGGCGDAYTRSFLLNFATMKPHLVDQGILGEKPETGRSATPPSGKTFTVSATDPAVITVLAISCDQSTSWGLKVHYTTSDGAPGEEKVLNIGPKGKPYQVIGGDAPGYTDSASGGGLAPLNGAPHCG